jgi:16S rRNA (guanine966-N2)-methyltransferase
MRVTGGRLGSRTLVAPAGMATRPTTDKVRQALFSVLGDLTDATVADLYAGTGALGIEALSRGARCAWFVESARPALQMLKQNIDSLGLVAESRVLNVAVERSASALARGAPFDLIMADPPWAKVPAVVELLTRAEFLSLLAPGGLLLLEHPSRTDLEATLPGSVRCQSVRRWGDTAIAWLRRADDGGTVS